MKDIVLKTRTVKSSIHCGAGAFDEYAPKYRDKHVFLVTDSNVFSIYKDLLNETFGESCPKFVFSAGEDSKNTDVLLNIIREMLILGMRRNCIVIAFGGGVVGDIAGLAASLYMRGVKLVQIPTTLLAQVDSSIGGKTAVDMCGVKNVIGSFYQPETVIADPRFFKTLPEREIKCGLGEIIKYGALDSGIYNKLNENINNLTSPEFLEDIVYDCIEHKSKVVSVDEFDLKGERKTLNLGHTTGHALELFYGEKSHGEYVLIGMYYELYIAKSLGLCGGEYAEKLENLVLAALKDAPKYENISAAAEQAVHDKKNTDEDISLIVPKCEGESAEVKLSLAEYKRLLEECSRQAEHSKKKLRLAVIGKDVSQSNSPEMHTFIGERLGGDITYDKISIPEEEFESKIDGLFPQYDGINVTIPYKIAIIPRLKSILGDANSFGAINTVKCADMSGYNTDGQGFMLMLKNNGVEVTGRKILVLGAGGAGRSVAKSLVNGGAEVCIYDKNADSALAVQSEFAGVNALPEVEIQPYYCIINATGVGMHKTEGLSPVGAELLTLCDVAVDLIYVPEKSQFLKIAEELGKKIVNGRAMLFYQAYYAECIFLGITPDAGTALKLFIEYTTEAL